MLSRDRRSLIPQKFDAFRETPAQIRWTLADLASRALSGVHSLDDTGPRVARLELPVGRIDPMTWLREQSPGPKSYWSGRNDGMEVAAVGVADLHEGSVPEKPDDMKKRLKTLLSSGDPRLRYYGGLRFDSRRKTEVEWQALGTYRFVLPRFELISRSGEATLACNLVLPR